MTIYYCVDMHSRDYITFTISKHVPKITVVTPSFNQKQFLGECIDSILSQNYPNLEYIIMDGGSTDGSVDVIKNHEKYLTYWCSGKDGGQYAAIHDGFRRSTGTIMTWLNSDDRLHNNSLYIVASVFQQREDVKWIMGRPNSFDEEAKRLWVFENLPVWSREKYLNKNYKDPYIQQEGTFWRRELWDKAGARLKSDLDLAGDLELWTRFFRFEQLYTVDALLAGFRVHPGQKTQSRLAEYHAEADCILDSEISYYRQCSNQELLPAPGPLIIKSG